MTKILINLTAICLFIAGRDFASGLSPADLASSLRSQLRIDDEPAPPTAYQQQLAPIHFIIIIIINNNIIFRQYYLNSRAPHLRDAHQGPDPAERRLPRRRGRLHQEQLRQPGVLSVGIGVAGRHNNSAGTTSESSFRVSAAGSREEKGGAESAQAVFFGPQ